MIHFPSTRTVQQVDPFSVNYNSSNSAAYYDIPLATIDVIDNSATSVRNDWGPKRDPLLIVIPITLIYILTFFTGVLGNLSTCVVIARNRSMHTATNYYLFSLAVSDLLLLISGLPPEIYAIWSKYPYIFGEAFCILQGFFAETSANATVLTITAFTIERYVAICHPFLSHTLSKLNRAIKFIIAIWLVAMSLAVPQALSFGIVCELAPDGAPIEDLCLCNIKQYVIPHVFEISTVVFFVAPMTLITVLYILIGVQLRSTVRPSRGNSVRLKNHRLKSAGQSCNGVTTAALLSKCDENKEGKVEEDGRKNYGKNAQATKHVVKMLVAVVVAFFICWAPFHAQRLLAIYGDLGEHTSDSMIRAFQILTYVSGVLYYLSTTVNPLLYHIMSNKFRHAFKNTFRQYCSPCRPAGGPGTPGGRCYSTLSALNSNTDSNYSSQQQAAAMGGANGGTLRYLDVEMARLQCDSARPLVVSFRRKSPRPATKESVAAPMESCKPIFHIETPQKRRKNDVGKDDDLNLYPTHICPLQQLEGALKQRQVMSN